MVSKFKADVKRYVKPKRTHGFYFFLFICGLIYPPFAVAVRFGIGRDFLINFLLVFCGYFPSHIHNFYLQNIRNNSNAKRTPKWAKRYGLVSDDSDKKRAKVSEWANRYEMNNPGNERIQQMPESGQFNESDYPLPAEGAEEEDANGGTSGIRPPNGHKMAPGRGPIRRRGADSSDEDNGDDHDDQNGAAALVHGRTSTDRTRKLKERNGYALPPEEFMNREYDGTDMAPQGSSEGQEELQHRF